MRVGYCQDSVSKTSLTYSDQAIFFLTLELDSTLTVDLMTTGPGSESNNQTRPLLFAERASALKPPDHYALFRHSEAGFPRYVLRSIQVWDVLVRYVATDRS